MNRRIVYLSGQELWPTIGATYARITSDGTEQIHRVLLPARLDRSLAGRRYDGRALGL